MNKKVNVTMITPSYIPDYSGYAKQAHGINTKLVNKGIVMKVIPKRSNPKLKQVDNIKLIHPIGSKINLFYTNKVIIELLWVLTVIINMITRRKEIDVVHILGTGPSTPLFLLVAKALKIPPIVKIVIADPKGTNRNNKLRDYMLKKHAYTVAISKEIKQYLIENKFIEDKILKIPNGVNTEKFELLTSIKKKIELKKKLNLNPEDFIVTHVGLNERRKGIDLLVKSWNDFKSENMKLLLIGPSKDAGFHEWLLQFIKENNLQEKISILGTVNNIDEYLKVSDLFVFPSEREGLPNALMEAMSSGIACIGRDIGGVNELIDHQKNGILCNTEGTALIKELSNSIKILANDKNKNKLFGNEARKKMVNEYSVNLVAEKYYEVYKRLSSKS